MVIAEIDVMLLSRERQKAQGVDFWSDPNEVRASKAAHPVRLKAIK